MTQDKRKDWCILRTGGQRTVQLARSLVGGGIAAWTPTETQFRAKTRRKPAADREAAILPTFVFARVEHLAELERCLRATINPHPAFSIFRHYGKAPLIADSTIAGLRAAEAEAKRIADARRRAETVRAKQALKDQSRRALPIGAAIDMPAGPFAGFTGVVESSSRKEAWVVLPGGFRIKIDTWLMAEDVAREPELV